MKDTKQYLALVRETWPTDAPGVRGLLYRLLKQRPVFMGYTLEPPLVVDGQAGDVAGSGAAIPPGMYGVAPALSPRFGRKLLKVMPPEGEEDRGILFHAGNTPADTQGCILVGTRWHDRMPYTLVDSRAAVDMLPLRAGVLLVTTLRYDPPPGLAAARWQQLALECVTRGLVPTDYGCKFDFKT